MPPTVTPVSANAPGLFVVLEGGEGVGKTTQWSRLASALRDGGHDVVALREPGGTPAGDVLRGVLLDPASDLGAESEALLFAASRAQLVRAVIKPALARGAVVLTDRFLLSTYVYQGAGRGLCMDQLRAVNAFATGGLTPDATLLLTMPLEAAMARVEARGMEGRGFTDPEDEEDAQVDDLNDLCEELRELVRRQVWMSAEEMDYVSTKPLPGVAQPNMANVHLDGYVITFTTAVDIPAITTTAPGSGE